jgi:hypothetical protein
MAEARGASRAKAKQDRARTTAKKAGAPKKSAKRKQTPSDDDRFTTADAFLKEFFPNVARADSSATDKDDGRDLAAGVLRAFKRGLPT